MAEKTRFPQIPSTVWWGVHSILNRTPQATLDERFLSVQLQVQPAAAKAYVAELISVGILNEDCRATPLAMKWRLPATYQQAVKEIVSNIYPQGLIDVAPPEGGDRQKAISWFMQEGLGQGSAGNKASTYMMIGSEEPNETPERGPATQKKLDESKAKVRAQVAPSDKKSDRSVVKTAKSSDGSATAGGIPLNLNVQIHISADATSDQIESIFSAMRRYLYDQQAS